MVRSIEAGGRGDAAGAAKYAAMADTIAWVSGGKKAYRASNQLYLGRAFLARNDESSARAVAEALEKSHPAAYEGPLLEGVVYLHQKEFAKAIAALEKAVALDDRATDSRMFLGAAYFYNKDLAHARAEFEEVVKIDPANKEAQNILAIVNHESKAYMSKDAAALAHFNKGEELFRDHRYKEALVEYEAAAAADPKFARPLIYMGDAYWAMGDIDNSVASYRKAIAVDPTDGQPWRFLGDVYEKIYDKTQDVKYLDLAIDAYSKAVQIDPSYTIAANDLARAQEKRSKANPTKPAK
jgi:tetratricopeptide (TPR) repeat protein